MPDHIAIILDGNRRWARARGLQPWEGHKAGYAAIKQVARASRRLGVHTFTMWAFSTENWDRAEVEINEIVNILRAALVEIERELHEEKVRLVHLGRKDRFPTDVMEKIAQLENETRKYPDHIMNIALDYGGRDETVRATNVIIASQFSIFKKTGQMPKPIDAEMFAKFLDTADQPYPNVDLFIRTSGEQRTSGLLPWQMEYAEFYWEPDHLPDFTPEKLREAILDYSRRRRRFGTDDRVEHLAFNPKLVADLEIKWQHELNLGEGERFRDLVVRYVKEHYGLSKELAKEAGVAMAKALVQGKAEEWDNARDSLEGLYKIVKKTLGLAFEPEIVANFEINLWRGKSSEEDFRSWLAEKFRFSKFQAGKSAHLGYLAYQEMRRSNWEVAKKYMERYYAALKERVA